MKRQIKFRVWDKRAKVMIYSNKGYQGHFIIDLNGEFHNLQNGSGGDDYIVQQYTGLKDKNGKEVYEGDIVYDRVSSNVDDERMDYFEVSYNEEYSAFILLQLKPDEAGQHWKSWNWIRNIKSYGEVVGNIFENPKLIKKPKKKKLAK